MDLFTGIGGACYTGKLIGNWRTVCYVEIDPYCQRVIQSRIKDSIFDSAPVWDDIRTFDGKPWWGNVDIITGGFPCQDISVAGKNKGICGAKSGLWKEMSRVIGEVKPRFVLIENSPALITRGFEVILSDLFQMGYDARWGVFSACGTGAAHMRKRLFIVSYPHKMCRQEGMGSGVRKEKNNRTFEIWGSSVEERTEGYFNVRMETESLRPRMADGLSIWRDRMYGLGNAWVPQVAATAWDILTRGLI